ncbi:Bacterial alpha-L-rhamnosidase [Nocardioides sp. BGMRC 2183]|nr:Bacterial alpha-L-rhamnosidase [Nocardioides sp. BGMRC 2183]
MKPRSALLAALAASLGLTLTAGTLGPVGPAAAAPGTVTAAPEAPTSAEPSALTVNGIDAPVDVEGAPHFGWHVGSATQTAYQVVVASSESAAADGDGGVWDSGKVTSDQQTSVAYDGPALDPAQRYYWSVRTWDGTETASAWASAASFGTGPGNDWEASPIWADVDSDNWADYELETDFTVVQNAASVTLRATSTSAFYLWQIRADTNSLKVHRGTTLLEDVPMPEGLTIGTGTTHHLKVRLEGATITTWIDDVLVDERTDDTYADGGFGFRTGRTEQARFDNLTVTDLAGTVLYSNDFASGAVPELPSLSVAEEQLVVGVSKNDLVPGAWSDYAFEGTLQVDEVAGSLRFRGADTNSSYLWQFRAGDNQLKLHKQVNGDYNNVLKTVDLPAGTLAVGEPAAIRVEAVGSTIKTWIDDVLVDTTTDASVRRGTIGFRSGSTERATWSELRVTDANTGTVLLEPALDAADRTFGCAAADGALVVGKGQTCLMASASADWSFLRDEFTVADKEVAWASVYATGASPKPAKQYVYKLYLDGEFVGMGPTTPIGSEVRYDGFDVTDQVQRGATLSLGALAYTTADQRFLAQLVIGYADGSTETFGTDETWVGLAGSDVYPEAGTIGTGFYRAPKENLDARAWPTGYAEPGFDAAPEAGWAPVLVKSDFAELKATPTDKVVEQLHQPVEIVDKGNGNYFVDFGRTWIGGVRYQIADGAAGDRVDLRFGETTSGEHTVRYQLNTGNVYQDVITTDDGAQTVETWGARVFRYLEIVGAPEPVTKENLQALAMVYPFDADASSFASSDSDLVDVYELSKNSIESLNLNFYTDSWTRERINYEADAYLQQMSSMYLMDDLSLARYSMNYFRSNRTWPTEWPIYVILAVADAWRQTGDTTELAAYYPELQNKLERGWLEESTGLIRKTTGSDGGNSSGDDDIVDWPTSERDGYQFRQYNTVINAIYYRAFTDMAAIAGELGEDDDAASYTQRAERLREAVNDTFYNPETGAYDDGMDAEHNLTGHYALHASAFALAFGVPTADIADKVAEYVAAQGMSCSVYCAAFLVKGLYDGDRGQDALNMLTDGTGVRSWLNMIELGAGSTMEAWDPSLKGNLTYSHPWAASPAFNVPAGTFGIRPTDPGYATFQVKPQPGDLEWATIRTPTVRGDVGVGFDTRAGGEGAGGHMTVVTAVPGNAVGSVSLPTSATDDTTVYVDGAARQVTPTDGYLEVGEVGTGCHVISTVEDATVSAELREICDPGADEAPVATELPSVTGDAVVGARLRASAGEWEGDGLTFTRQWLRDGSPIPGAVGATYRVKPVDVRSRLSVQVAATRGDQAGIAISQPTARVTKRPTLTRATLNRSVVKRGAKVRLQVRVAAGPVKAGGKVRIRRSGAKPVVRAVRNGRLTLTFTARGKGRKTVRVAYLGSAATQRSAAKVLVYRVRR